MGGFFNLRASFKKSMLILQLVVVVDRVDRSVSSSPHEPNIAPGHHNIDAAFPYVSTIIPWDGGRAQLAVA